MKKNLFLYLFIFSLLINVFTYMFFTGKQKFENERLASTEAKIKTAKDSLVTEKKKLESENYFTLENDVNAKEYFAGKDVKAISIKVRDEIYKQNITPGGNPLVGYPAMDGSPFTVAKIRVLNHRWVIADFTNGKHWGEVILKYFIEENGSVSFERADSILYEFKPY